MAAAPVWVDWLPRAKGANVRVSDVAREAGVSLGTVSNTLNKPHVVSELTRERVLAAIKRLDYVPNQGAASLRSGTSRMLGLVIPDVTNAFYAEIAKGVAAAAEAQDYAVVLCNTDDQSDRELRQLEMLARHRSAGALIVPRSADESRLDRLRKIGSHLILIDRVASEHDGCSISIDDVRGGRIATAHLLKLNRKKLVLVNGPDHIPQCVNRRRGMQKAMISAGIDPQEYIEISVDEMSIHDGERAAEQILALPERPDGVFCINDQLAIGVLRGLARHRVPVPMAIAVVGYGDSPIAEISPITLTTVRQPMFEIGRTAVARLLSEVEEPAEAHRHSSTVFTPSLVIRESAPQASLRG